MHPTLALLSRHTDQLASETVHWFDDPLDNPLANSEDLRFSLEYREHNNADWDTRPWQTGSINILFYPKAKQRLDWWLQQIVPSLNENQSLWIVGENQGGIKSVPKHLKGAYQVTKIDSARHCALFEIKPLDAQTKESHWQNYQIGQFTIWNLPGVFSLNRLDTATQLLIDQAPKIVGTVLEFGSGSGVLANHVAHLEEVRSVITVDNDLLAVQSARRTFQQNQVDSKAKAIWSDGLSQLTPEKFDVIISNPPFHQGIRTAYRASEEFFAQASQWLNSDGQLTWVANEFLNYEKIVEKNFQSVQLVCKKNGFKVFVATRPKK